MASLSVCASCAVAQLQTRASAPVPQRKQSLRLAHPLSSRPLCRGSSYTENSLGSVWSLGGSRSRGPVVCGLFGLGVPEVLVVATVAAVLFGPKNIPDLGKSLGKTVKSFQEAAKEFETEVKAGAAGTSAGTTEPATDATKDTKQPAVPEKEKA